MKSIKLSKEQQVNIADCLESLRKAYGLTLHEVSRCTGIPVSTLYRYELDGQISEERLNQVADYYELPPDQLLAGWEAAQRFVPRS